MMGLIGMYGTSGFLAKVSKVGRVALASGSKIGLIRDSRLTTGWLLSDRNSRKCNVSGGSAPPYYRGASNLACFASSWTSSDCLFSSQTSSDCFFSSLERVGCQQFLQFFDPLFVAREWGWSISWQRLCTLLARTRTTWQYFLIWLQYFEAFGVGGAEKYK